MSSYELPGAMDRRGILPDPKGLTRLDQHQVRTRRYLAPLGPSWPMLAIAFLAAATAEERAHTEHRAGTIPITLNENRRAFDALDHPRAADNSTARRTLVRMAQTTPNL